MDKQTAQRQRDDALTDEQFLAQYEQRHGHEAAMVIARTMGITPKRRKQVAEIVGNKAKPLPAIPYVRSNEPGWRDRGGPANDVHIKVIVGRSRTAKLLCAGCDQRLGEGEMLKVVGRVRLRTERFHPGCIPADLRKIMPDRPDA